MKVIILAAGSGKRFRSIDLPKPLTKLSNEKSIIQQQLDSLSPYINLNDILVVVGYRKEKIIDHCPDLLYVYNQHFASQNTSKSLLKALQKVNEDVLWINGDVVFHPNIIKLILTTNKNSMIVNEAKVGDEEVKYRTDKEGRILEISKDVKNPQGEALGINFFKASSLPLLIKHLDQCSDSDYFEKGIELCIKSEIDVWSVPIGTLPCVEIDFPEDLKKANDILW